MSSRTIEKAAMSVLRDLGCEVLAITYGGKRPHVIYQHGGKTYKTSLPRSDKPDPRWLMNYRSDIRRTITKEPTP